MLTELRRRLTRGTLLGVGLLLVAYSLVAFWGARWIILWGLDEANRHLAMPVVAALAAPGAEPASAPRVLAGLTLAADERLEVVAGDGRTLASHGGGLAGMPIAPGVATWQGAEPFRVLTVRVPTAGGEVFVRAAHAATRPHQALVSLGVVLAGVLPPGLLLAWALADRLTARATAPVEAAVARELQFTRDASHELRTPLAALQAQLALAAAAPDEAPAKVAQAQAIARRMGALVGDLLALSREDAGVPARPVAFDMDDLIAEELALVRGLARERGVALQVVAMPEDAGWVGDADRVARAVRTLLENALQYTPAGGRITVACRRTRAHLCLTVCNDGAPIPSPDRERIFERFYRGAAGVASRPEGTGLGLAIGRAIARAHGGDLTLASGPGEPPCFELRLGAVAS